VLLLRRSVRADRRGRDFIFPWWRRVVQEDFVLCEVIGKKLAELGATSDEAISPLGWKAISACLAGVCAVYAAQGPQFAGLTFLRGCVCRGVCRPLRQAVPRTVRWHFACVKI
jgi:hypothetical protein